MAKLTTENETNIAKYVGTKTDDTVNEANTNSNLSEVKNNNLVNNSNKEDMPDTSKNKNTNKNKSLISKSCNNNKAKISDSHIVNLISGVDGITRYSNDKKTIDLQWFAKGESHEITYKELLYIKSDKPNMFRKFMLIVEDELVHTNHNDLKESYYNYYNVSDLKWINTGKNIEHMINSIPKNLHTIFISNLKEEFTKGTLTNISNLSKVCDLLKIKLDDLKD